MFKPDYNVEPVEVLTQPEQRRRRSIEEKLAIVRETFEPGATVSGVGRLVEQGSHSVLLQAGGRYTRLHRTQYQLEASSQTFSHFASGRKQVGKQSDTVWEPQ